MRRLARALPPVIGSIQNSVETSSWLNARGKNALMESVSQLCGRVVQNFVWGTEFALVLACLECDMEVPGAV